MSLPGPPTRWALASAGPGGTGATDGSALPGYAEHLAALVAEGADVDGEARLADALVGRGARVLDVGAGMGRVAAALVARGHDVTAIEPDPALRAQAAATYPGLDVLDLDARAVDAALGSFDLVVCVGNVAVYLAEGTERAVLAALGGVLAPGGRMLVGYHPVSSRGGARDYADVDFRADVVAAGLAVQGRWGGYDLTPPTDEYAVWLLARAGSPTAGRA